MSLVFCMASLQQADATIGYYIVSMLPLAAQISNMTICCPLMYKVLTLEPKATFVNHLKLKMSHNNYIIINHQLY